MDLLKSKENYQKLKDQISQIVKEFKFESNIAQTLIKNKVPDKKISIIGKVSKNDKKTMSKIGRRQKKKPN